MKIHQWHNLSIAKIYSLLNTGDNGIAQDEAKKRLGEIGANTLPQKKNLEKWQILLNQLLSPLVYILLFAAIISIFLKSWLDLVIIFAVVLMNTVIGFMQENKANDSISKLKNYIQYKTNVLRDGKEYEIVVEEIVPGDIILLGEGEKIPADARLIKINDLEIIEASLTGEAVPSKKNTDILDTGTVLADRENMVYMGTIVARGRGTAVVCETGRNTELGNIATLIQDTPEGKTPLQQKLENLTRSLALIVICTSLLVVLVGVLKGRPFFQMIDGYQVGILYTGIVLAVAAIPEGLLVAVTVILALGIQKILKEKALVRRLVAAETLGSTSVICTDKTGTLTEGKMKVVKIVLPSKAMSISKAFEEPERRHFEYVMTICALCNNSYIENFDKDITQWNPIGDPTETALLLASAQYGLNKVELEKEFQRLDEIPFSSEKKFMATLHSYSESQNIIYVKGSPESIMEKCELYKTDGKKESFTSEFALKMKRIYEEMSKQGLRVLAFAYKKTLLKNFENEELSNLIFIGFVGIKDPLRKESRQTFLETKRSGIRTVIVTGDHKYTTQNIALEMGMKIRDENIIEGRELDKMTDEELYRRIKNVEIFARVNPHHKLRIIDAWQKRGEVVAMTGDGVNDAPALKSADIGIAFNSGTDVAKENADLVLLDNNFKTIISAIEQGRIIFDNIRKVILYLLSNSFAEIAIVLLSLLFDMPLPLIPAQILWINLIDDGLPALSLTKEQGEKNILLEKPRNRNESVLNFPTKLLIMLITVSVNIPLFLVFAWLLRDPMNFSIDYIRTIIFTSLALSTLFYSFSCRSLRRSIFHADIFSNMYLNLSVFIGLILQVLAVYHPYLQVALKTVPLTLNGWLIVISFSLLSIIIIELGKYGFISRKMTRTL